MVYDGMIRTVANMMRDVHTEVTTCLFTVDEYNDALRHNGVKWSDIKFNIFNFIYHFGKIYDSVVGIMAYAEPDVVMDVDSYYALGKQGGSIFKNLFFHQKDFEYPDITIDYPTDL